MASAALQTPEVANVEAEAALCGALMQANNLIDSIADNLAPEHFFEPLHGRIFAAIVRERSLGRNVNPITLKPYFDSDPAIGELGGTGYLAKLTGSGIEVIGARDFAAQIRDLAERRRLIAELSEIVGQLRESDQDIAELIAGAEGVLASERDEGPQGLSAAECVSRLVDSLGNDEPGVRSGIGSLDATLGPCRKHDLTIIGGRPGMGKSALASSYGLGAASRGHGTLFISREMSSEDLAERMAADLCFDGPVQVPYACITNRRCSNDQAREMARAVERIRDLPLVIEDKRGKTLGSINSLVRRHQRRFAARHQKLELVIIDYLQLVSPDTREKDLYTRVSEVSKGLKDLAKTHGVAVMALAQLSREVERRADKRPIMADLRDSGQIEQDADAICFLYSPEYYLLQEEDTPERAALLQQATGKIEFIVPKRRRGPGGVGHGRFYRAYQAVRG